jgi:hypothetical protein
MLDCPIRIPGRGRRKLGEGGQDLGSLPFMMLTPLVTKIPREAASNAVATIECQLLDTTTDNLERRPSEHS